MAIEFIAKDYSRFNRDKNIPSGVQNILDYVAKHDAHFKRIYAKHINA